MPFLKEKKNNFDQTGDKAVFPKSGHIYIEELPLPHAGLACKVVLARAVPRDFTLALDFIK